MREKRCRGLEKERSKAREEEIFMFDRIQVAAVVALGKFCLSRCLIK
jgi:hypothetical protein